MRLIGYIRVSRVAGREGETFISPAVQRERIEAQAKASGHVLVDVLQDLDQPGSKYERPAFQQALERLESGEGDGLIVYSLDRFARSVPDAAVALRRLEEAGAVLVSVRDALDTSTPVGRFARTMMLAIAELELERIRENWATARDRAIARGVHITNRPPLGYLRGGDGRLEPDPATAPIVRELFQMRAAGASWHDLAAHLDARLPRENGAWPLSTVQSMLTRRTYVGEARAGAVVNAAAHAPIVSEAEWRAAQSVRSLGRSQRNREGALLAGLLHCESCGQPMTRMSDGRRGYRYYKCSARRGEGVCPGPAKVSTPKADAFVEAAFGDWLATKRVMLSASGQTAEREAAIARVEAAQHELEAYRDANLISVIGREAYADGLAQRARVLDQAHQALLQREREGASADLLRVDLAATWPDLTTAERRTILGAAIERVEARRAGRPGKGSPAGERLRIVWRADDTELVAA